MPNRLYPEPGLLREDGNLILVQQENMPVAVRFELHRLELAGIGTFRKFRKRVAEVTAVRSRHHHMAARLHHAPNLPQEVIGMRDVLDDLGDEHHVETALKPQLKDIARRKPDVSLVVLESHVFDEIRTQVVPSDRIPQLGKAD